MSIFTGAFWRAAAERAAKTFAQTEAALLTANGTGLLDSDWRVSLSVSGMAAVISLLTSVGSDGLSGGSGPSLGGAEITAQTVAVTAPKDATVTTTTEATFGDPPEAKPFHEGN